MVDSIVTTVVERERMDYRRVVVRVVLMSTALVSGIVLCAVGMGGIGWPWSFVIGLTFLFASGTVLDFVLPRPGMRSVSKALGRGWVSVVVWSPVVLVPTIIRDPTALQWFGFVLWGFAFAAVLYAACGGFAYLIVRVARSIITGRGGELGPWPATTIFASTTIGVLGLIVGVSWLTAIDDISLGSIAWGIVIAVPGVVGGLVVLRDWPREAGGGRTAHSDSQPPLQGP